MTVISSSAALPTYRPFSLAFYAQSHLMRSLLCRNLGLTLLLSLAFTLVGYARGWIISFYLDGEAAQWILRYSLGGRVAQQVPSLVDPNIRGIETSRLDNLKKIQVAIALAGTSAGFIVAQTTFLANTLTRPKNGGARNRKV